MSRYVIHSDEALVFRDGRPFGDAGIVDSGIVQWPLPPTIIGMMRTQVGLSRDPGYFSDPGKRQHNIRRIKSITSDLILPMWQEAHKSEWRFLYPVPADALLLDGQDASCYSVHGFAFHKPEEDEGINLPWSNWLLPTTTSREKPAQDAPGLWFEEKFFTWLQNYTFPDELQFRELGVPWPQVETRMHTAIGTFGTAQTGQLFSTQGIRLQSAGKGKRESKGRYGIGVVLSGLEPGDNPTGACRFGGERKIGQVELQPVDFPACPGWFEEDRFLRLVLISPGNFGSWAPDWLRPSPNESETPWRELPQSAIKVRLVSAFIPRWMPVSGWDFEQRQPRATRKLVPAGAVYVIKLHRPEESPEAARLLWGRSIADDPDGSNGYDVVCVGKLNVTDHGGKHTEIVE
ncbi:MAG: type III-B CRISPR module-associated Cmr3 family protein [bacterium]|nr:type III-B CRISPR module-associated Cmr3 family protein [bacterium]